MCEHLTCTPMAIVSCCWRDVCAGCQVRCCWGRGTPVGRWCSSSPCVWNGEPHAPPTTSHTHPAGRPPVGRSTHTPHTHTLTIQFYSSLQTPKSSPHTQKWTLRRLDLGFFNHTLRCTGSANLLWGWVTRYIFSCNIISYLQFLLPFYAKHTIYTQSFWFFDWYKMKVKSPASLSQIH